MAFAGGLLQRGSPGWRAAGAGALALTAANVAYYAWIASLEPGVELAAVAGSPRRWLALGACGGAVFGVAGRLWIRSHGGARILASLPLAGVCIADGIPALLGGPITDGVGLALGAALPVLSASYARERIVAAVLSAAVVAVALTGRLEALLP